MSAKKETQINKGVNDELIKISTKSSPIPYHISALIFIIIHRVPKSEK
jgi:hypothetical protein